MFVAILVVHVLVCILLILIVLLQAGRGADLGAAFGSVGQATFSRGSSTFMSKFTTGLAVVFMLTSLSLAFISSEKPSQSILSPIDEAATPFEQSGPIVPDVEVPVQTLDPTDAPPSPGTFGTEETLQPADAPPRSQE